MTEAWLFHTRVLRAILHTRTLLPRNAAHMFVRYFGNYIVHMQDIAGPVMLEGSCARPFRNLCNYSQIV